MSFSPSCPGLISDDLGGPLGYGVEMQGSKFLYTPVEGRVLARHPLPRIRTMVDKLLRGKRTTNPIGTMDRPA